MIALLSRAFCVLSTNAPKLSLIELIECESNTNASCLKSSIKLGRAWESFLKLSATEYVRVSRVTFT